MFKTSNMKFGSFTNNSSATTSSEKPSTTIPANNKNSSSKDNHKINSNDFVPKRFGLKFDPPTIILEYLIPSSGKLYHHKMKLPKLKADSDMAETIEYLKNRHFQYFINNKISELQLKNLIEKLKKKLENEEKSSSAFLTNVGLTLGPASNSNSNKGGNKLGPLSSLTNKKTDSDNDYDENKKLNTFSKPLQSTNKFNKQEDSKPIGGSKPKSNDFWDFEEIDLPDSSSNQNKNKIDYNTTNLNKLSKQEIDQHKKNMDVLFNKNKKDKDDPDFVYDVQEEFQPHEDNEWDEDLEF